MTDRPIIFSAPMVRAILDGRKTQTRRVIKWQGPKSKDGTPYPHSWEHAFVVDNPAGVQRLCVPYCHPQQQDWDWSECAAFRHYGLADPGDRLWVRETWRVGLAYEDLSPSALSGEEVVDYVADSATARWSIGRTRSPIHMPRWASRLTLLVTDVRVQRLQEISEEDARAEGVRGNASGPWGCEGLIEDFADLWESIHGPGAWEANPWVCAVRFTTERRNIDA